MVVGAAALWGANGTVSKVVLESGLSTWRLAELRCAGATVLFVGAAVVAARRQLRLGVREIPWFVVYGVLGLALGQFFSFVSLERLEVGVALVISYLAPVWVALWAYFFVHEPVRRRLWYGLALALAGLGLVVELWTGLATFDGAGGAAAFACSLSYALYILLAERGLAAGRDVLTQLAFGFAFATLFWTIVQPWWTFPGALLDDDVSLLGRLEGTSLPLWSLLAVILVLGTFVPFLLMIGALHHLPATRVMVIAMIEPVVASLVAFGWLGEELGPAQIAGGMLVLAAVALAQTARGGGTARAAPSTDRRERSPAQLR